MILEMGFAETLNAILENLPKSRQTLLFSATLSKNVRELVKLSIKDPEYILLHDKAALKQMQVGEDGEQTGATKNLSDI